MEQNTLKRRGVGLTGVDKDRSFGGYTLFCPLTSDTAHLVDIDGKEVHSWKLPGRIGRHARILPNGNLAVNTLRTTELTTKDGGPFPFPFFNKYGGGVMSELDPDGKVVRQFTDDLGHHDQYHYGDGRFIYTGLEALSPEDSAKVIGGVPGSEIDGITYADTINEVDEKGNLVWQWKVSERLPRDEYPLQAHYTREHYPLINSVIPMRDGKHILASLRSVSAVIIIERSTGNIVWKLGPEVLAQQHNATELDNGNILIFDNGAFRNGESITYTRAIEVDRQTKNIAWEYRDRSQMHNFFTPFMGSAQRLANGNTLLCESAFGRLFEVTKDGYVCWEFINPHFAPYPDQDTSKIFPGESNALFRAYRYSLEEIPWLKKKLGGTDGEAQASGILGGMSYPSHVSPISGVDNSQGYISPSVSSSIEVFGQTLSQISSQTGHDSHRARTDHPQLSALIQDGHGMFVFIGDAANLSFLQIIRRLVRDSLGPCVFTEDALQHLMVEAKPSDSSIWLVSIMDDAPVMPEEAEARYLVSWFFRSTSCVLNLFEEGQISESMASWYQKCSEEQEDKASVAVFFLIFAIGAQTCPENRDKEAEQYFNYGRFLTTSVIMDDISISAVQSNILITMYLLGASRRNAAFMYLGSAFRAAYALGIQRHDVNKHFKQSEYLVRERLWKVLRVLDLFMSASLGRPPSIHETRNTGTDENCSASNDLCAIFEDILTNIYSPQKVSNSHLERISEHHRQWANKFPLGLATDSIKQSKFIDEADGKETPNIGLCHLKEAYCWTIMLLARPSLTKSASKHMYKASQDMSQWEPSTTATEPDQVLAFSCVDSAVRTVDLLKVMGDNREIPKRLPFVVNSLFVAELVLGTAYFNDLDHIFPLEKSMVGV
ncbi:transcriptional regulatory [Fusarium agapanthi]|uniref:Transcriptional regulatory n=1 Tax=Fusarium agapanthi TaxID=1803897 RepID=A0A9P5BPT2_9HYPO|nr:transcriptional regulatory [Fusarium agapanthi]